MNGVAARHAGVRLHSDEPTKRGIAHQFADASSSNAVGGEDHNHHGFGVAADAPQHQVKYGYRAKLGPHHWYQLKEDWQISKLGQRQSPVDIADDHVVNDSELAEIAYDYHCDNKAEFINDGLLPKCNVTPATHYIRGGPLGHDYELAQFHFHFAAPGKNGSEHALNGKRYPAEVHFVHFKKQYGSVEAALTHADGLAVVGAVLDVSDAPDMEHAAFDKDIRKFANTKNVGMTYDTSVDLPKYGLSLKQDYYTYGGSLTSPPCCECVCWIMLARPIAISPESYHCMTDLRSLEGGLIAEPGNFRPVQPLHGRRIRHRQQRETSSRALPRRPSALLSGIAQSGHGESVGSYTT